MEQNIIAVSQVNEYIKFLLDRDELLANLCVRGEISNYKVYPSGHHYFTLKDAEGALRCVMFRSSAQRLRFKPENGMQVVAHGRVTVFPRDGAYQLYCSALTADGAGDLYIAFEQLKEKLSKEGLFDPAHKKTLPKYRIPLLSSLPPRAQRLWTCSAFWQSVIRWQRLSFCPCACREWKHLLRLRARSATQTAIR